MHPLTSIAFTFALATVAKAQDPASATVAAVEGAAQVNVSVGFTQIQPVVAGTFCPQTAPCASEAGFCGIGRNCLSGCNPLASFLPSACYPVPACIAGELSFNDDAAERIHANGPHWDGDSMQFDWIVDSGKVLAAKESYSSLTVPPTAGRNLTNGSKDLIVEEKLLMSLSTGNNGTALSSTHSMLYGNVTGRIKSTSAPGVVTSFVLMSGTGDEINFEFTSDLTSVGTAYFWHGSVGDYSSSLDVPVADRSADFHDYGIIWTADMITWTIDGAAIRNVTKESTLNTATGAYHFPQSPARVQLLIWGAGAADASQGVIDWSGGAIDWTKTDTELGFASYVESVTIACADSAAATSTSTSASATPTSTAAAWWQALLPQATPEQTGSGSASLSASHLSIGSPVASATASIWWPQAVLHRRAADTVPAYAWGDLDDLGEPGVTLTDASNIVGDGVQSGLDLTSIQLLSATQGASVTGTAISASVSTTLSGASSLSAASSGSLTASKTTSVASASSSSTSASASASATGEPSLKDKWEDLGIAAHVGIYVGGALLLLLVIALVGWVWRRISRKRAMAQAAQGHYAQIHDGGQVIPGPVYTGSGEIVPGQDLYAGGQAPSVAAGAAAAARAAVSRKPTYAGGYKPSSKRAASQYVPPPQAMSQYAPGYEAASQRKDWV